MKSTPTGSVRASPTTEELVRRCLATSKILCGVALVLPAMLAVGMIFDIRALTHGYPEPPAMRPNTAVGLTLSALAILFTPEPRSTSRRGSAVASLLALLVLLLGMFTLSEYLFSRDWGIDRVIVHLARIGAETFPGRS